MRQGGAGASAGLLPDPAIGSRAGCRGAVEKLEGLDAAADVLVAVAAAVRACLSAKESGGDRVAVLALARDATNRDGPARRWRVELGAEDLDGEALAPNAAAACAASLGLDGG